ncbi:MAG: hypothetical protein OXU61_02280 [Gammaproteobacteria bacterium]|nr:hypothetical protein [Gammaproteobacteria bacterium]
MANILPETPRPCQTRLSCAHRAHSGQPQRYRTPRGYTPRDLPCSFSTRATRGFGDRYDEVCEGAPGIVEYRPRKPFPVPISPRQMTL